MTRTVTVLGATGVIGQLTLEIIRLHRDKFSVFALTARSASENLAANCCEFQPHYAVVENETERRNLQARLSDTELRTEIVAGEEALLDVCRATGDHFVVAGISGSGGLKPLYESVVAGATVLIANKEPVVMLGALLGRTAKQSGAIILPVDSEHNAIFQCAKSAKTGGYHTFEPIEGLRRILLTGTGGPFRDYPIEQLGEVVWQQAVAHPVWNMGHKISVDSATMMNKGLEIIEARWLFDTPAEQVEVLVHPQGVVHSMVEYLDGSVLAQLALPDMRVSIASALFWPGSRDSGASYIDFFSLPKLEFAPPDMQRFPCLQLAQDVAKTDNSAAIVLNGANEVAVEAFLKSRIRFTEIAEIVSRCLDSTDDEMIEDVAQVEELDKMVRNMSTGFIKSRN